MPTYPHTNHGDSAKELSEARPPISFCREKCSRTFFFRPDPQCAEANRPLARNCRRCDNRERAEVQPTSRISDYPDWFPQNIGKQTAFSLVTNL